MICCELDPGSRASNMNSASLAGANAPFLRGARPGFATPKISSSRNGSSSIRRGSRLTDAGHVLAARAAQALANLELAAIAGLQTGTIHLGASTAPGVYLLPDTLGCFRRSYPGVTVDVEVAASGEILKRLLAGRVQLALVGATRADGQGGRGRRGAFTREHARARARDAGARPCAQRRSPASTASGATQVSCRGTARRLRRRRLRAVAQRSRLLRLILPQAACSSQRRAGSRPGRNFVCADGSYRQLPLGRYKRTS